MSGRQSNALPSWLNVDAPAGGVLVCKTRILLKFAKMWRRRAIERVHDGGSVFAAVSVMSRFLSRITLAAAHTTKLEVMALKSAAR
jgi:hypothetical protein